MSSTSIYIPFTYCIIFIPTGQRYYGSRYANNKSVVAHPTQLWTTYFTSSETIANLIEEYGIDSFSVQIRKTFSTRSETVSWETKFLTRINAAKSPNWLNDHNGGRNFHSTPNSVQKRKETMEKKGNTNSNTPETVQKCKDTKAKNGTGMDNPETIQKCKDTKAKNGTVHCMKIPEFVQKCKDTKAKNGTGMDNPEMYKRSQATKVKNGMVNPSKIPFFSIIATKKTYAKNNISSHFPEFKQYY